MSWRTLARQKAAQPAQSEQALCTAYRDVFGVKKESVQLVMADLAAFTGFYQVVPQGTPNEALQYQEGSRAAFARIYHFLSLTDEQLMALEQAARSESGDL